MVSGLGLRDDVLGGEVRACEEGPVEPGGFVHSREVLLSADRNHPQTGELGCKTSPGTADSLDGAGSGRCVMLDFTNDVNSPVFFLEVTKRPGHVQVNLLIIAEWLIRETRGVFH